MTACKARVTVILGTRTSDIVISIHGIKHLLVIATKMQDESVHMRHAVVLSTRSKKIYFSP